MEQDRYQGFEVCEDLKLKRMEWRVQRIVWPLLVLFMLAVLAGILGKGPLSHVRVQAPQQAFSMEYERFLRYGAPDALRIELVPDADSFTLQMDGEYVRRVEIERIMPRPTGMASAGDVIRFTFRGTPGRPAEVAFHLRPEKAGTINGWIALEDGPRQRFRQFVYP